LKLWAGVRYRISILAVPMVVVNQLLSTNDFRCLPFLGINNNNVKWEWRTTHKAFDGMGLFSFVVEPTIGMINMFVQYYGEDVGSCYKIRNRTASSLVAEYLVGVISRLVMYRTKVLMYCTMVLLALLTKVRR
jgi:hypothetical protein